MLYSTVSKLFVTQTRREAISAAELLCMLRERKTLKARRIFETSQHQRISEAAWYIRVANENFPFVLREYCV